MTKIGLSMGVNSLYNSRQTFEEAFPHQTSHISLKLKLKKISICHTLNQSKDSKSFLIYEL